MGYGGCRVGEMLLGKAGGGGGSVYGRGYTAWAVVHTGWGCILHFSWRLCTVAPRLELDANQEAGRTKSLKRQDQVRRPYKHALSLIFIVWNSKTLSLVNMNYISKEQVTYANRLLGNGFDLSGM